MVMGTQSGAPAKRPTQPRPIRAHTQGWRSSLGYEVGVGAGGCSGPDGNSRVTGTQKGSIRTGIRGRLW